MALIVDVGNTDGDVGGGAAAALVLFLLVLAQLVDAVM